MNKNVKINILKKCIGKRYVIITDHKKNNYYFGEVRSVVDENNVIVQKNESHSEQVNIFDIRSPTKEYV